MQTVEELLADSPALASLPPEHRATMAGCARLRVFYPGDRLLQGGRPGRRVLPDPARRRRDRDRGSGAWHGHPRDARSGRDPRLVLARPAVPQRVRRAGARRRARHRPRRRLPAREVRAGPGARLRPAEGGRDGLRAAARGDPDAAARPVRGGTAMRVDPPASYRVTDRRQETEDAWTLRLEAADGDSPSRFAPGQFSMLYVFGSGEVPISVSAIPDAGTALVHTVRAVGAVTRSLCAVQPGAVVGVRGPYGRGWPLRGRPRAATSWSSQAGSGSRRCAPSSTSCSPGASASDAWRCSTAAAPRPSCSTATRLDEWRRTTWTSQLIVDVPDQGWNGHVGRRHQADPPRRLRLRRAPWRWRAGRR